MSGQNVAINAEPSDPTPTPRRVGVPTHERLLTEAFLGQVSTVVRSGPGRSLYVLEEADLGAGRPDIIVLTISSTALNSFRESQLRLTSPVAARALDVNLSADELGVTRSYAMELRRNLQRQGWSRVDTARLSRAVHDSLAIEAKVRDWRSAVRQVAKFRRLFHRSAVLMPERALPIESSKSLEFYGCGVIFQRRNTDFSWERFPRPGSPPTWTRIWLLELLVRGLEDGSAYKLSASRKLASASR